MQRYGLYARRDQCEAWLSEEIEPDGEWVHAEEALAQVEALKESGRKSADDAASALDLLSRVRFALGDNGTRMQSDLITYCAELRDAMALCKQAIDERDHYGQILTDLLDALSSRVGRFTDGEPIDPVGHAYDDACEAIGRDQFQVVNPKN